MVSEISFLCYLYSEPLIQVYFIFRFFGCVFFSLLTDNLFNFCFRYEVLSEGIPYLEVKICSDVSACVLTVTSSLLVNGRWCGQGP